MAVPIYAPTTGEVIGHLAALDKQSLKESDNFNSVLKIFAARAGAEIERKISEEKLIAANEKLKKQMDEIESLKNRLQMENNYLQEEIRLNNSFDEIVSKSKTFAKVLRKVEQVAATDATVLILGESGTGKELLCRAIHRLSKRSERPLVKVNCAALPANLIESELFGHEKGSFTGATERKIGRFELADRGTIFLDEIGELPFDLQSKLLRVLQEGEFERIGNPRTVKTDVRVIAATNRDLEKEIQNKTFREDLYYRLNVFPIESIPLRERLEDIPILVSHFCKKYETRIGKKITKVSKKAIDSLMSYNWPGNVRELENIIERAIIVSPGDTLVLGDWLQKRNPGSKSKPADLNSLEREHILEVLNRTQWKVSGERGAAKILGLKPTTLEARMKKLKIIRPE
jgi:transcriptional regulator with GAF, ATPase, and Fis domain